MWSVPGYFGYFVRRRSLPRSWFQRSGDEQRTHALLSACRPPHRRSPGTRRGRGGMQYNSDGVFNSSSFNDVRRSCRVYDAHRQGMGCGGRRWRSRCWKWGCGRRRRIRLFCNYCNTRRELDCRYRWRWRRRCQEWERLWRWWRWWRSSYYGRRWSRCGCDCHDGWRWWWRRLCGSRKGYYVSCDWRRRWRWRRWRQRRI